MVDLNISRVTELHYENCDDHPLRIKIDFEEFPLDSFFMVCAKHLILYAILLFSCSERFEGLARNQILQRALSQSVPELCPDLGQHDHQV